MMSLNIFQLFDLLVGSLIIWVGIYLVSKDYTSKILWVIMLYLFSIGTMMVSDAFLREMPSMQQYIFWQKYTDWTVFFIQIFFFHLSLLISGVKKPWLNTLLILGYILAVSATIMDSSGNWILNREVIRFTDYRRFDGFGAGPLLVPVMGSMFLLTLIGNALWLTKIKPFSLKYFLPLLAGLILSSTSLFCILAFNFKFFLADLVTGAGMAAGTLLLIYSILRFHIFSNKEKIYLNSNFYLSSLMMLLIVSSYIGLTSPFLSSDSFGSLILTCLLIILIMLTHSFYGWFSTFVNDIAYNFSSGLSVVTDDEVAQLIKNYNSPHKLEDNPLLRLNIVKSKIKKGKLGIDVLKELLEAAVSYFEPKQNQNRRIKSNLKYQIIKMIAYDEAEEGQILWNLGFDEYPLRIMSQAGVKSQPQFRVQSPSDYTYLSRNAYLALKKEAIHNLAWRISYLEKNSH